MNLDRLQALAGQGAQLLVNARPRNTGDWYRISNAKSERAEILLYGAISDWDGITADAFVRELRGVTADAIDLRINSPGGLVFDAVAIYSALRNHPATVDVSIDSLAASAASFVAMAGDTIVMQKPSKLMIHDAAGLTIGNADDMRQMANLLDELSDTIAEIYADRAGGSVGKWRDAMRAETWYSSADAVKAGLADRVAGETPAAPEDRRSQALRAHARATLGRGSK